MERRIQEVKLATNELRHLLSKDAFIIWAYTDPLDITYHRDDRTFSCRGLIDLYHVSLSVLDSALSGIYDCTISDYEYNKQY